MVKLLACAALLAAACYEDRYRCTTDEQCDLGQGGRCENDGYCTAYDVTCPTERRYTEHSELLTGVCFDGRVAPANPCAGGQTAADPSDACAASVCEALPMCCSVAWTDACAQVAQERCDVRCDTRIALTATRNANSERWALAWDGTAWSARLEDGVALHAWIAPAPGATEPRYATAAPGLLTVGDVTVDVPVDRVYQAITSADVDRDLRDTVVATYQLVGPPIVHGFDIIKLDDGATRATTAFRASQLLSWGDLDRDAFPDGVVRSGTQYYYLDNVAGEDYLRRFTDLVVSNVSGGTTPSAQSLRSFDWLDLDRDTTLDLVVFGTSVRIHARRDAIADVPQFDLDCDPPDPARGCMGRPEPDFEAVSFAGAALPARDAPAILIATFPHRRLYVATHAFDMITVRRLAFPDDNCMCTYNMMTGNWDCAACVPIQALVTRDLDGDHRLDIIAIDSRLRIYHALAANNYEFDRDPVSTLPTLINLNWLNVWTSVTGAPLAGP